MKAATNPPEPGARPLAAGPPRRAGETHDCAGFEAALAECGVTRESADAKRPVAGNAEHPDLGASPGEPAVLAMAAPVPAAGSRSSPPRASTEGAVEHPGETGDRPIEASPEAAPSEAIPDPLADLTRLRARLVVRGAATLHRTGTPARAAEPGASAAGDASPAGGQPGTLAARASRQRTETAPSLPLEIGAVTPASRPDAWPVGAAGAVGYGAASGPGDRAPHGAAGDVPANVPAAISPATADRLVGALPSLVRTLDIELEPGDLGRIDMRLRLGGKALELELRAQDAVSERVLRSGRERLLTFLAEAGYAVEALAIRPASARAAQRSSPPDARSGNEGRTQGEKTGTEAPAERPASPWGRRRS